MRRWIETVCKMSMSYCTTVRETEFRLFDSFYELIDFGNGPQQKCDLSLDPKFVGRRFESMEHARKAATELWHDGIEILERMTQQLADAELVPPPDRRRRLTYREDTGDEIDYDRLRAGQEYWRSARRRSTNTPPVVTIITSCDSASWRDSETILWRGAAAIVLAKLLEAAGCRVELHCYAVAENLRSQNSNKQQLHQRQVVGVCLKRPDEPLDAATLVNSISGWCFRTVWFECFARYFPDQRKMKLSYGLGRPDKLRLDELREFTAADDPIIIDNVWGHKAALAHVREVLSQFQAKAA